ncbi:hypothetical protein [Methanogenium cariaci]|uniref:hypothetical protein n=1 Tax=Methanogenium cariaci TaxID=2197 RepID=UPI001FE02D7D|nr:hypothetical protein [Methanogenium cariaci]
MAQPPAAFEDLAGGAQRYATAVLGTDTWAGHSTCSGRFRLRRTSRTSYDQIKGIKYLKPEA